MKLLSTCKRGNLVHSCCPEASSILSCSPEASSLLSCHPEVSSLLSCCPEASSVHSCCPEVSSVHSCHPEASSLHSGCPEASSFLSCSPEASSLLSCSPEASHLHSASVLCCLGGRDPGWCGQRVWSLGPLADHRREAESPSQVLSVLSLPLSTLLLSFCCYSGNFQLEYHRRLRSVVGEGRMVGGVSFGSVTNQ